LMKEKKCVIKMYRNIIWHHIKEEQRKRGKQS